MLLFRSEEHVVRWTMQWGMPRGGLLTLDQASRLARAWYGPDRRDGSWRRPTLEEAESLLESLGVTGPFWTLLPH